MPEATAVPLLFAVRMDVSVPAELDSAEKAYLLVREKAYSRKLQRSGHWGNIWRCASASTRTCH